MIVGITGRAGSGKTTLANAIVVQAPHVKIFNFADSIKYLASEIFDIAEGVFHVPKLKEELFHEPIAMDDSLDLMRRLTGLDIKAAGKIAKTPRQLLQYFGTEYVRAADPEYWVRQTIEAARGIDCCIADVRFGNEADAIRAEKGMIVKVIRDYAYAEVTHVSENINDIIPDRCVYTQTGDMGGIYYAACALAEVFKAREVACP